MLFECSVRFQHRADFSIGQISASGRFHTRADFSIGQISHSGRFQHRADFALGRISASECYKTVLILETRFCEAGAAESLEIGKIEVGSSNRSGRLCKLYGIASNKSGRRCKPFDEINLLCLMYLDLSVTSALVGQMPSLTYQV